MKGQKAIIIGLGHQAVKDHIPAILKRNDIEIVSVVDKNLRLAKTIGTKLGVDFFNNVDKAIKSTKPDLVIVSVPHHAYFDILKILAENKIATLKEKPIAMSFGEAKKIIELYRKNNTYFQVCVQRRFSNLYGTTKKLVDKIGNINSIYIEYTLALNADEMASGWRADIKKSGGGAVLDMGYHIIDLLTYIFDIPKRLYAQINYQTLSDRYTIDDTMKALMVLGEDINTNIVVTKIYNQKSEKMRIFGINGSVYVDGRKVTLYDSEKNEIESHIFNDKQQEIDNQLEYFVTNLQKPEMLKIGNDKLLSDQIKNIRVIDAIYESNKVQKVIKFSKESK